MMKSILFLVILICNGSNLNSQYLEITCDQPFIIYNNHVGNEWSHALELDGKYFSITDPSVVETSSLYKVNFVISEANETHLDFASTPLGIDPSKLEWNIFYSKTLELIVTERNGRYAGNTAKWQVTIHFKKIHGKA